MKTEVSWMDDWTVGVRVWVERAGKAVLGRGRLELLEEIDRRHSISAAARHLGMSYRHAWVLVQETNEAAGEPLVEAVVGGSHGGGAQLTAHGRLAVAVFRDLHDRLRRTASGMRPGPPDTKACVRVAAAISLEEVLGQLLTDYAQERPGVRVRAVYGASDELADQILAGAPADLLLTADARQAERLRRHEALESDAPTPLAENTLAVVGRTDAAPAVRRPADLAGPAVRRIALGEPSSPLGGYSRAYLDELGLYEAVRPRAVWTENAHGVAAAVQAGQADAGLTYGSAAAAAAGCRVLFRARRLPMAIRYVGVALRRGRPEGQGPRQARDLLGFLASVPAARRFRRCGFLTVSKTGGGG
jgi:molybdenum ABC transporter molybdate-binding protein